MATKKAARTRAKSAPQRPAKTLAEKTPTPVSATPAKGSYDVASLICGILGVLLPVIGIGLAIAAIILYFKQRKVGPSSMATAGLVLGIIGIILQLLIITYIVMLIAYVIMISNVQIG